MLNLVCGDCLQAAISVLHLLCVIWPWKVDWKVDWKGKKAVAPTGAFASELRGASPTAGLSPQSAVPVQVDVVSLNF